MNFQHSLRKTLLIAGVFAISLLSYAQKAPMKYGKVDPADLAMTSYPLDSTASAVILCNYGYFDANNLQFVHQIRIKILKEEGKMWGDYVAPAAKEASVKGQTVNLENGVPVVTKLSKESTFIEKITKGVYRVRVAMPNVKVGSVIDLEIFYKGLPSNWKFQERIPVRWSELIIEPNTYLTFRKNFRGYVPLNVATDSRWVTQNVPAFKSEPYVNNIENYLTAFDIELSMINIPGYLYEEYATDWQAVVNKLDKDDDFGQIFSSITFFLGDVVKQIKTTETTPEGKLAKAYNEIKKIKWDKKESIWMSNSMLSTAFNKKIGNVADINMTLILLLRKLDIDAYPVVLSTRENGVLPMFSVSLDKFNYVICKAVIGDKTYLIDATESDLPLGMLPERTLNGRGLIIKRDMVEWVDLNPTAKDKTVSIVNVTLSPDGTLKGELSKSYYDYAALDQRNEYKTFNSQDDYIKSIENDHVGLSVGDYEIKNIDSLAKPVSEKFSLVLKNRVAKANNQYFIEPMIFGKWSENPFKLEQRTYPVDFVTPMERTQILNLTLPEGYTIEQSPANIKMVMNENGGSFQMQTIADGNRVQVLYKFFINKPVFYQQEYDDLKAFVDQLVKKHSEMIVIKKI